MTLVAILTPVKEGEVDALRGYLRGLRAAFAGLQTHFARMVVLDADGPRLLFSAKFDGPASDYLAAFARVDAAVEIWRHCQRPDPCNTDTLVRYLVEGADSAPAEYEIDMLASPPVTVAGVNAALRMRTRVSALAARAATLDATALAHELRQLLGDR